MLTRQQKVSPNFMAVHSYSWQNVIMLRAIINARVSIFRKSCFKEDEIKAHYACATQVGRIEGSLRRAYNRTEDEDQTILYRYR